jgi:protocatechuate 3,4-dioxygenase beta subunit
MHFSRRHMFSVAGAGTLAAATASFATSGAKTAAVPSVPCERVCSLMPDVVDGPYYDSHAIMRSDITEGKLGIPLEIRVCFVDSECRPIEGARIDCWQADAGGIYSNHANQGDDLTVATIGETFLRGTQITDKNGFVLFRSIYPGWYRARTAHVHFKVYVGGQSRFTTQMFFPDAINEYVYLNAPLYRRRAVRDTVNITDWILADASRHAMANIREEVDRYVAEITFGVNPRAMPAPSKKMPCPSVGPCVPPLNTPPDPNDRVAALIPSTENLKRPRATKPSLPL